MVFHLGLSDSKSPQVSRTLLSILAVLNNAVVWMVSTRPPTSKSFIPFSYPLLTVPNAPITIGMIVTCMFHSFFNSLAKSRYYCYYYYYYNYYYYTHCEFFALVLADGLWLDLRDNKSPQVSITFLSILADLKNSIIWIVSVHFPISNSSIPLSKL